MDLLTMAAWAGVRSLLSIPSSVHSQRQEVGAR